MQATRLTPATNLTIAIRHTFIAMLLTALLAGCSTGIRPPAPAAEDPLQQQARALETEGDFLGAAQIYLQAAAQAAAPHKYQLQLQAAAILIRGGDIERARQLLEGIPEAQRVGDIGQHYTINRAAIALAEQHPDQVLAILASPPANEAYLIDFYRLRAEAQQQNSRYFLSARERVQLDPLLTDPETQLENEFAIWEALNSLTDGELQELRTAPSPDILSGWMELVELTRLYLQQPEALAEVIPHWQQRYPGHPAGTAFIAKLLETMQVAGQPPERIALLLPLSGALNNAAAAVRNGIIAAYYDTPGTDSRPQLSVYDSGNSPDSALAAYHQAITDGAGFVIGPLRKNAVEALATQPQLTVPTLALNQTVTPGLSSPGLYQFGLAPEDEAREVARLAWRNGHTRSIALLPDTDWGERVYAAFAEEWQQLGGVILEAARYNSKETDHGKTISALLNLDSSKARHQQLTRQLGQQLMFEPRRRQDADFVFLLASPGQARLIRPQLSFYRATTLPVYATSRVFSGHPDPAKDADINGIVFCDMPWVLETGSHWAHLQQAISEHWPGQAGRYARLYALGIDAYRVIPYISELGGGMFGSYHGVTGNLSLGGAGQINRTLRCARFRQGLPVLLEPTAGDNARASGTTIH
jgi:outer membrane PBP1 activator LpoA protein